MTRRIYGTDFKRQLVLSKALLAVREAREALDPALLEKARQAIGESMDAQRAQEEATSRPIRAERVPVDQKKNLTIVMKYLELNPDNKALHREIQAFLAGH